jgi:hypothetical protein
MRLCPDTYVWIEYAIVKPVDSIIIADIQPKLKVSCPPHVLQVPTSDET